MKKFFIIVCASVVTMTVMAQSQKISASLDLQIRQVTASAPHRVASKTEPFLSVFVHTTQPEQVADAIKADGYYVNVLGDELLTTQVHVSYIETLETNELVTCLEGVDKQQPNNDLARVETGASKIHNNIELETPFTGKGVLVGIIDGGLKWNHIAFKKDDGTSRFKWIWERRNYPDNTQPKTERTTTIPDGEDLWAGGDGHGTHVAGTAAGSRISENDYYGIATEADIVGISTSFIMQKYWKMSGRLPNMPKNRISRASST
jgi:subtilisin family serine protease